MKYLVGVILYVVSNTIGYSFSQTQLNDWFEKGIYSTKNQHEIPTSWQDASAVILYKQVQHHYVETQQKCHYVTVTSRKIKLQDYASVIRFTTFHHVDPRLFRLHILKNNTFHTLNIDSIAIAETKSPTLKKMVVPDLAIGDIIFIQHIKVTTRRKESQLTFPPHIHLLSYQYPLVAQHIEYHLDKNFYINIKSFNQAPQFSTYQENEKYILYLKDSLRSAFEPLLFDNIYTHYPLYKEQVYFLKKGKIKHTCELIEPEKHINTSPINYQTAQNSFKNYTKKLNRLPFRVIKKELRQLHLISRKELVYLIHYKVKNASLSERDYYTQVRLLLNYFKFDYDIIIASPVYEGGIDETVFFSRIKWLYKVNLKNESVWLMHAHEFQGPNEIDASFQQMKAYKFKHSDASNTELTSIEIPTFHYKNQIQESLHIDINLKTNQTKVVKEKKCFGEAREQYKYYDYAYAMSRHPKLTPEDYQEKFEQPIIVDKVHEEETKVINSGIPTENHKIISLAQTNYQEPLEWTESYTLNHVFSPANKNFVMSLGLLFGVQNTIDLNLIKKFKQTYIGYPKEYKQLLNINIPKGYTPVNLEDFTITFENNVGSIYLNVKFDETKQKLVVIFNKSLSVSIIQSTQWKDFYHLMDLAFDITQKKLLLQKI